LEAAQDSPLSPCFTFHDKCDWDFGQTPAFFRALLPAACNEKIFEAFSVLIHPNMQRLF
jgi:hypothetical protein